MFLYFPKGSDNYSYRKIWSLLKGIENTCILSFFFLLGNRIVLFFHNSNSNRLIYSVVLKVPSFACFRWLFWRTLCTLKSKSSPTDPIQAVPRVTETKPKYRNETEIPERNIKIIGKHIQMYKCHVYLSHSTE